MKSTFDPNAASFKEGAEFITALNKELKVDRKKIITSKDKAMRHVPQLFRTADRSAAPGFTKWALPIFFTQPTQVYLSFGAPNQVVEEHSHDEGDGLRIITGGSIFYGDHELTAGDWMFIPARARYGFKVGKMGVSQCYCYSCCCAGWKPFDLEERINEIRLLRL